MGVVADCCTVLMFVLSGFCTAYLMTFAVCCYSPDISFAVRSHDPVVVRRVVSEKLLNFGENVQESFFMYVDSAKVSMFYAGEQVQLNMNIYSEKAVDTLAYQYGKVTETGKMFINTAKSTGVRIMDRFVHVKEVLLSCYQSNNQAGVFSMEVMQPVLDTVKHEMYEVIVTDLCSFGLPYMKHGLYNIVDGFVSYGLPYIQEKLHYSISYSLPYIQTYGSVFLTVSQVVLKWFFMFLGLYHFLRNVVPHWAYLFKVRKGRAYARIMYPAYKPEEPLYKTVLRFLQAWFL